MFASFIETLRCPYCFGSLRMALPVRPNPAEHIQHGIVRCPCYEYPIVDGILVLQQLSGPSDSREPAVTMLHGGDTAGARAELMRRASMVPQESHGDRAGMRARLGSFVDVVRRLVDERRPSVVSEHLRSDRQVPVENALREVRPSGFASYLFHRYANPSFVSAVAIMGCLEVVESKAGASRQPLVLDLACGVGHSTAMMKALFPSMSYVAADPDFVNLTLLREHFVEDATCICLNAEVPLPFGDDYFDAVLCLDAFHYIRSKAALVHELDRILDDDGLWVFPHLHNRAVDNPSPGIPLRTADYLRLVDFLDVVLIDEAEILDQFFAEHSVDLSESTSTSALEAAASLCMVAGRHGGFRRRFDIGARLVEAAARSPIGVNPIYQVSRNDGKVRLAMTWPNPELERECSGVRAHLPEHVELSEFEWDSLRSGGLASDSDVVVDLLESFVLTPLPPGYFGDR